MKSIKEWSIMVCCATTICTILELISPNGKMDKIMKFVLSSFLICSLIFPLNSTVLNIPAKIKLKNQDNLSLNSSFKRDISDQAIDIASDNIKSIAKQELNFHNISFKKIDVLMDTDSVGCISIIKVKVYLNKDQSMEDVKKILETKLGTDIEVVYWSD